MGYMISPLKGLGKFRFHHNAFCNGLLTQDTNGASPQPDEHVSEGSACGRKTQVIFTSGDGTAEAVDGP